MGKLANQQFNKEWNLRYGWQCCLPIGALIWLLGQKATSSPVISKTAFRNKQRNMIRYDMTCYFNVRSKPDVSQLNLKPKKWKKEKTISKNWYAQKYWLTVWGIHGVHPWKEKEGYGGKDLQKRKVLSLKRKSKVMDDDRGESMKPMKEVPLV